MRTHPAVPGRSPEFEADALDWALGELLHMVSEAKRAGMLPHEFNPLLSYRCVLVIGCQPRDVAKHCVKVINDTMPGIACFRSRLKPRCS